MSRFFSPVSGAYGASTVNVQQVWEKSRTMKIFQFQTQSYSEDMDGFNAVVEEMKDLAVRGFTAWRDSARNQIDFRLEMDMR